MLENKHSTQASKASCFRRYQMIAFQFIRKKRKENHTYNNKIRGYINVQMEWNTFHSDWCFSSFFIDLILPKISTIILDLVLGNCLKPHVAKNEMYLISRKVQFNGQYHWSFDSFHI